MSENVTFPKRGAFIFIFFTVVLDMLAVGLIIPVLPKLVASFVENDSVKSVQIYGIFALVWAVMQFFCAPILGALSDRFGRRPVILISNFGLGLDYILMALAPSLSWLFLGRVISGITAATVSTAGAYIADVTPVEKRAAAFGMLGAAFGIGFVFGPAVGGVLGGIDPRLPFWVAAALNLANACYGLFVLPESLSKDKRIAFSWKRANPVAALSFLRETPNLAGLATASFISAVSHDVLPTTFVLYATYRYQWNETQIGMSLAAVGVCSGLVQGVLVGPIVKRFGQAAALLGGLLFGVVGFVLFGFADTELLFWIGVPFVALWGIAGPASQSIMTSRVEATEQGRLQGAVSSMRGMASLVAPVLFSFTFASFIDPKNPVHFPGAAFVLAAMFLFLSFVISKRYVTILPPSSSRSV